MENFVTIGAAAAGIVERLRSELGLPAEIILFTPDATTNIGPAESLRKRRREPNRTTGRA